MRKILITLLSTLFVITSSGSILEGNESGIIKGKVTDKSNQETIPFANIIVEGTNIGTTTDFDGNFQLNLNPGKYNVIISYIGYQTDTLNVNVSPDTEINLSHEIISDSQVLASVDLVVKADRESETALLVNQRKATEIVQNIGAKELSRKGVSTVADGLKKVSGISTVSSKFVVVRGLGDRYNAALLNGLPVPSTNPDMKVPELNLFPTNIVSNIKVTKTYSSQYYGDYAGGMIDIQTKASGDEPVLSFSLGTGFNSQTIGQEVTSYQGGRTDYFGFDDGTRSQPNTENKGQEGERISFHNGLNPTSIITKPNSSFSAVMGNSKTKENGAVFGYLATLSHSNSSNFKEGAIRVINKQNSPRFDYTSKNFEETTNSSALASIYFAPNTNARYAYNFVGVGTSSDATRETRGSHFDYQNKIYSRRNTFQRNAMYIHQLTGEYDYDKTDINWAAGYSKATNETPDRTQLVYLYNEGDEPHEYVLNARDRLENQRWYSQLDETEYSALANVKYYLNDTKSGKEKEFIDFGVQGKYKVRNFDYQQYMYNLSNFGAYHASVDYRNPDSYLNEASEDAGAISIEEVSNPASAHKASLMVAAGHANASIWMGPRLQVLPGLRTEFSLQSIQYKNQTQPSIEENNQLLGLAILPHLGVRFNVDEKTVLRFAGSKTVSRPGFKEVAPFEYTEVFAGTKTKGNPELQNGQNYNADLKMEFYPNSDELFSVSVFGKYLNNPIEKNMKATASGQLQSFQNADKGIVAGIEIEMNKKLSYLFDHGMMKDLVVGMNLSALTSTVTVKDEGEVSNILTNATHPLQGASPILLNVDISYAPQDKGSITLAYNWFGERLYAIGVQGLGDIYEQSYGTLNLIGSLPIKEKFQASLKLKNLLNPSINTVQYNEGEAFTINEFQKGINVSIGLSMNF